MRRWLSFYALGVTSIVIVAFLVPLAVLIRDLSADRALTAAEREAQAVARFVATTPDDSLSDIETSLTAISDISVVLPDGRVLGEGVPDGLDVGSARSEVEAYRQEVADGQAVVVPIVRGVDEATLVVVHVTQDALRENVAFAWSMLGGLGVTMVFVALLVADRMGRAVLQPVDELVDATHRLGEGDLSARVRPSGPQELREVGDAFNTLTRRVVSLMDRERESAADLAHRLRTPLTALKLDIENLSGHIDVGQLTDDVEELERVTSHIISEARRPLVGGALERCDLVAVMGERAAFWGNLAEDQNRQWALNNNTSNFVVDLSATDVEAMFDAVLGNVFAHTAPGTPYRLSLVREPDGRALISIEDRGPGIDSPDLLTRGASGGGSTGLGVDIVRRIAHQGGGTAEWISDSGSGTTVEIRLPAAGSQI